jgi:hypothetical protein
LVTRHIDPQMKGGQGEYRAPGRRRRAS